MFVCTARNKFFSGEGFTLIELLVVVTIIVITTGALLPSFTGYIRNQNVKQAQEQLKSDVRTVQNKALAGALSDQLLSGNPVQYWGIRFTNASDSYDYFISTTNTTCPATFASGQSQGASSLSAEMEVKIPGGGQSCLYFSMSNGSASRVNFGSRYSVIVGYAGSTASGDCRRVNFNTNGLIYSNNVVTCTCANAACTQ